MTTEPVVSRHSIWHPLVVGSVLIAVTVGVAGVAGIGGSPTWSVLGLWLCLGAAAGYAASGST